MYPSYAPIQFSHHFCVHSCIRGFSANRDLINFFIKYSHIQRLTRRYNTRLLVLADTPDYFDAEILLQNRP